MPIVNNSKLHFTIDKGEISGVEMRNALCKVTPDQITYPFSYICSIEIQFERGPIKVQQSLSILVFPSLVHFNVNPSCIIHSTLSLVFKMLKTTFKRMGISGYSFKAA